MLGKGLESLIPQKGNGSGNGDGGSGDFSSQPPASLPEEQTEKQTQPESRPAEPRDEAVAAPTSTPAVKPIPLSAPIFKKDEPRQVESVFHIEVEKITPNPNQPRRNFDEAGLRDLAHSIREFGFLQPLVVSKLEKETATGIEVNYQLIAGERRLMAAKMLGLHVVPAIVRNVDLEREKLELAVIENIQRENLNPIEAARAFQRLQEEFRMTQREIAVKLGKSREAVANAMRLLDLPEYVRLAVEKGELSESNARLLLAIVDPGAQKNLFEDIIQNRLTTRDVKERVAHAPGVRRRGRPPKSEEQLAPELKAMQESLSADLGAPVEIHKGANTGKITITFYSEEELENILHRLGKENQ
jgi:ParB family chromosome partitioning protein